MLGTGQKLSVRLAGDRQPPCIGMPPAEFLNLQYVFEIEDRACDVEHFATRREGLPKAIHDLGLLLGKCGYVGIPAQPFDVGMPAHDTAGRARYIGENTIVTLAVPPVLEIAAIGDTQIGLQSESIEILGNTRHAFGGELKCGQRNVCGFEDMCGLAARRGAGVEHPLSGMEIE